MGNEIKCPNCESFLDSNKLEKTIDTSTTTSDISTVKIQTDDVYITCPICGERVLVKSIKKILRKDDNNSLDPCTETLYKASMMNTDNPKDKKQSDYPTLKIRYHRETYPDLPDIEQHGNFIDLYTAETVSLSKGDFHMIDLGISVECPKGYWMQIVPRSSTFKNWGILQVNSFGVLDTDYCGDNDIVKLPVYATRDIIIPANTRICQFRLVKDNPIDIVTVEKLEGPNRGGFGSTGNYQNEG